MRARQAYQRAIPLDRDFGFAGAEKSLGELAIATSQQDEAVEQFRTALKLWPYDQAAQKRLVSVLESQGKVPEAVTILEQGAKDAVVLALAQHAGQHVLPAWTST